MTDDGRITADAEYGQHIALTCKNHPELTWSTKNIGSEGEDGRVYFARSIFFTGRWPVEECDCPGSCLRVKR